MERGGGAGRDRDHGVGVLCVVEIDGGVWAVVDRSGVVWEVGYSAGGWWCLWVSGVWYELCVCK